MHIEKFFWPENGQAKRYKLYVGDKVGWPPARQIHIVVEYENGNTSGEPICEATPENLTMYDLRLKDDSHYADWVDYESEGGRVSSETGDPDIDAANRYRKAVGLPPVNNALSQEA